MLDEISKLLAKEPGLKGREIAKKLSLDRRVTNSFLSKNKDHFFQDGDYRWSNITEDKVEVSFPSHWVTEKSFENSIKCIRDVGLESLSRICFHVPSGCKFLLIAIARFLSLANQLAKQGIEVEIDMNECSDTQSFFNRTGFYDYLHEEVATLPERPSVSMAKRFKGNSNNLVELGEIDPIQNNRELIIRLGERFVEHSSDKYELVIKTVFSELIGNVRDHSESELPGFAALQVYTGTAKHIQTVVSDSGLGIAETLRTTLAEKHPTLFKKYEENSQENNSQLVLDAFTKGEVSRYGKGRGLGFKSSREHATKEKARISIRQSTFVIDLVYENGTLSRSNIVQDLVNIDGTHICFDFFVDNF